MGVDLRFHMLDVDIEQLARASVIHAGLLKDEVPGFDYFITSSLFCA